MVQFACAEVGGGKPEPMRRVIVRLLTASIQVPRHRGEVLRRHWLVSVVAVFLVVAACEPGTSRSAAEPATSANDAWRTAALVDVRTGESFTIDGLRGKLVAIEPMAAWCTNCAIQQGEAQAAQQALATTDLVYISLDVDPNERAADLADYADQRGYDWRFVVAGPEVARSLAETFGDQVLSPPSTPLILIGADGAVIEQHFGIRGASDLVGLFSDHLP